MAATETGMTGSADGTAIAFERSGAGPALILVEAAGHYRAFSSFARLAELLAPQFTVYRYDRRGRGDSGDTPPYTVEREVEDVQAIVEHAGGSAFVYGFSSGALLAMHAVAAGVAIPRLALLEPPIDDEAQAESTFTKDLAALVAAGRRLEAVDHFNAGIGVPAEIIEASRDTPAWSAMAVVAHTLVYDCKLGEATTPALLASVTAPTLVLDSDGSTDNLTGWAASISAMLPNATHRSLPGQWHGVADDVLAPALSEFFEPTVDAA